MRSRKEARTTSGRTQFAPNGSKIFLLCTTVATLSLTQSNFSQPHFRGHLSLFQLASSRLGMNGTNEIHGYMPNFVSQPVGEGLVSSRFL